LATQLFTRFFYFYKMEEKILTQHPQGKKGVNILKRRYDEVKTILLDYIEKEGEPTFEKMADDCAKKLEKTFDGKPLWYIVTVKPDLEARGIIERIPKTSPHKLRLKK